MTKHMGVAGVLFAVVGVFCSALLSATEVSAQNKPDIDDPYSLTEGPLSSAPLVGMELAPPGPGAVILDQTPADYDWWNGCSPTATGMLFGWWDEAGYDSFPGDHRNLPSTYPSTSMNPNDYTDARGVIAGWAHKQEGINQGIDYGSYGNHAPDSLADFLLTHDGGTSRSRMPHAFQTFGAWDDVRTTTIESQRFSTANHYISSGWTYEDYCSEIDAGRPVHLGLSSDSGGHSVLGVGYNDTGGRENIVLLTTWHWELQEWEWENETSSGREYSVYGGTLMDADAGTTPRLSAYFSIAHTYVDDLTVELGVGDPNAPDWNTTVWNSDGGSEDNLVLTDINCGDVLPAFLSGELDWYLKVADNAGGDVGSIQDFQIRYEFDQRVFQSDDPPVPINDYATSFVYLTTIPEPSTLVLAIVAFTAFLLPRRTA